MKIKSGTKDTISPLRRGLRDGIPIGFGYFAVAFSLGIIAGKAGLNALEGFIGSIFTRASAGEYGGYTSIAIQASLAELVLICIIANLRYLLMGAALTQKFHPDTPLWKRLMTACCITDEIFGISIAYEGCLAPSYTCSAALISGLMWAAGTTTGILAGGILPVSIVSALSVALYGMFIAIIIPPSRKDRNILAAVTASFLISWLCTKLPYISTIDYGTKTIILTILISVVMAWLKPVPQENGAIPMMDTSKPGHNEDRK